MKFQDCVALEVMARVCGTAFQMESCVRLYLNTVFTHVRILYIVRAYTNWSPSKNFRAFNFLRLSNWRKFLTVRISRSL